VIPVLGLLQHGANAPAPPTTSGHPLAAADQIELGTVTMRALGLKVGDKVTVGAARRPFTVVGTVTLPSMGTVLTDHVSLGRGAMMEEDAMLAADRLEPYTQAVFTAANANDVAVSSPFYPSAVAIYARSGADARQAAASILRREPDGTPGGMYTLPPQPAAQIVNFQQMGGLPLTIALGVAIAAVLALALTIVASVRQRRRELALLKSLGMRRSQLRAVVFSQASTILVVAIVIGIPSGIAAGRWAWAAFANAIGVVPAPVVPTAALALGVLALLAAGNILATWPAAIAARTSVARTLRSE
jgi:ABC-type antimicrobial peptide transport system permease subunit